MKSRYVICFFFLCLLFMAAFQFSYRHSLDRSLPETADYIESSPLHVEAQVPKEPIVTSDMIYFFETFNQSTEALLEEIKRIPVEFLGKTREEIIAYLEEETQLLKESEPGFVSLKLLTFSENQLIIRKVVAGRAAITGYYLTIEEGFLVVYNEDRTSIFLHTNIAEDELPADAVDALQAGINLENADALYDYLETCTS